MLSARRLWFVVAHATDAVSKYQLAARIPNKSSASVIDFMTQYWWPILGAPRQIVADQGRERGIPDLLLFSLRAPLALCGAGSVAEQPGRKVR